MSDQSQPSEAHALTTPAKPKLPLLKLRHRKFLTEYFKCHFNGTQAAINSGYSVRTAREQASQLLTRPDIAAHLAEHYRQYTAQCDEITATWTRQMRANIAEMINDDGSLNIAAIKANGDIVTSYSPGNATLPPKVKFEARHPASLALAKFHGMFRDDSPQDTINIAVVVNGNVADI